MPSPHAPHVSQSAAPLHHLQQPYPMRHDRMLDPMQYQQPLHPHQQQLQQQLQQQQQMKYNRPFRCEKCMQSFSRNHDLKRHERIHLDVKPFPCPSCEKSFSRKDALKRHALVKGCRILGNNGSPRGKKKMRLKGDKL
ncbi:uncharacterized protein V1510DRAFT_416268 [Dipodascopsis tothii]|uniref:uncharacterized protein n=1 Tax=Dipodascopsis tothii TaxID=44089 RepID=UPI0034CE64B8